MAGGNVCYDKKLSSTSVEALMKWNMTVAPSENLLGTMWKLDSNGNGCYQNETNMEYLKIYKYNFLTILADRILITNLGNKDKMKDEASSDTTTDESYIHLKYAIATGKEKGASLGDTTVTLDTKFMHNKDNKVRIVLDKQWINDSHIGMNSDGNDIDIDITLLVDPLVTDDDRYANTTVYSSNGPRKNGEIIKGMQLRTEINFTFQNYKPEKKVCYWRRMTVKNSCAVDPYLYSDIGKKIKCMKYEAVVWGWHAARRH